MAYNGKRARFNQGPLVSYMYPYLPQFTVTKARFPKYGKLNVLLISRLPDAVPGYLESVHPHVVPWLMPVSHIVVMVRKRE